jgi:hypothetical protein
MPKAADASYYTSCRFLGHHFVLDAIFVAKIHGAQGLVVGQFEIPAP